LGLSCLLASRRSGTPRICGAERTESRGSAFAFQSHLVFALRKGKETRTEGFPALAEALVIDCIDDVDDCVAIIVVFRPDGPDPALASEVPELEYG
jgi:hypothetical protein